jgi:hypothetical protein
MKYLNIDIENVTVTFTEENKQNLMEYFPSITDDNLYDGWISDTNPSKNFIGFFFAVNFEKKQFIPDFHNLPFYYQKNYEKYMNVIVNHVRNDESFYNWGGENSPIALKNLKKFVTCLNSISKERNELIKGR